MDEAFVVPLEAVELVRSWFKLRGGVLRWRDQEIGGPGRPDLITPAETDGKPTPPPHGSYLGSARKVAASELMVCHDVPIETPAELAKSLGRLKKPSAVAKRANAYVEKHPDTAWSYVDDARSGIRFYKKDRRPFTWNKEAAMTGKKRNDATPGGKQPVVESRIERIRRTARNLNAIRAQAGVTAMEAYKAERCPGETDSETVLADLLADLRHAGRLLGLNFDKAVGRAHNNYEAECGEEGAR